MSDSHEPALPDPDQSASDESTGSPPPDQATPPEPGAVVRGRVSRVPLTGWRRVVAALSLWLFLRSVLTLAARVLGMRREAEVTTNPGGLILSETTFWLGRVRSSRQRVVPWSGLQDVTLVRDVAGRSLNAGLTALTLGTYFGTGLFIQGLRAPGGAPALLGVGLVLIAAGLLLDFGLEQGWLFGGSCQPNLVVRGRHGQGFRLECKSEDAAAQLLDRIELAVSSPRASATDAN